MLLPLPVAIFFIIYWLINRNKNSGNYPVYKPAHYVVPEYQCKFCRKRSKINYQYCPRCEKDDNGLTARDNAIIKIFRDQGAQVNGVIQTQQYQQKQIDELNHKFNRFSDFITALRRKFRV